MAKTAASPHTKATRILDIPRDPRRKIWMGPDQSTIGRKNIERMVDEMIAQRWKTVAPAKQRKPVARRSGAA